MGESNILVEEIIYEDEAKGRQIRFVISEFRGVAYLHLREYYLSFDEGYVPSKEGVNIPTDIVSVQRLFTAFAKAMAQSEYRTILQRELDEIQNTERPTGQGE